MDAQTLLNQKYEKLCQIIGDLECQKYEIEQNLQRLRAEVKALNSLVPDIKNLESFIKFKVTEELKELNAKTIKKVQD